MGLFDNLFKTTKKVQVEDHSKIEDNKIRCLHCETLVDKSARYCKKCGNPIDLTVKEKELETTKIVEEKLKYQYADLELIEDEDFRNAIKNVPNSGIINFPLGLDNDGRWLYYDVTKMPNLLIGGTVMTGKTSMINSILLSLICKYSCEELRIILADSKGIDYLCYDEEPHLLGPVITDSHKLLLILMREMKEMENRYLKLKECGEKNIYNYNYNNKENIMPYHLIFIDDYTSFVSNKIDDYNLCIKELAKNGWNVGIHLIIVANHPTAAVLPSISKINFPTRISFKVPSIKDSRMILETNGAEKICGIGNALIYSPINSNIENIHINFINDHDISIIVEDLVNKNKLINLNRSETEKKKFVEIYCDYEDPLFSEIVDFVVKTGKASASLLQRKFKLSYNRAARIMDILEERGIVSPQNGSKPREVLVRYDK